MFRTTPHQPNANFGADGPLRVGDWLLRIDDEIMPFNGVSIALMDVVRTCISLFSVIKYTDV